MAGPPYSGASGLGGQAWRTQFEARLRSQARWSRLRRVPTFVDGNHATFLDDGRDQLQWIIAAIDGARARVDFEMYIVADDEAGRSVRAALVRASERGARVRVLFDSIGSADAGEGFFEPLRAAGADVVEFNPVAPWRRRVSRFGRVQAWRPNTRDHRKLVIADVPASLAERLAPPSERAPGAEDRRASIAIVGGRNLGDEYLSRPLGEGQWRDCGAVLVGPIIQDLAQLFDQMWLAATEAGPGTRSLAPRFESPPAGEDAIMAIGTRPGFFNLLQWALARLAWSVERELRVSCAYFIPSGRWRRALKGVVRRGAACELLLPKVSDLPIVDAASRHFWGDLLRAGVHIHLHASEVLHEKTLIFDRVLTVIGSSNLDPRSFRLNYELSVLVLGGRFAQGVVQSHAEKLARSERCTLDMWTSRGVLSRLSDWFWSLFRHQL